MQADPRFQQFYSLVTFHAATPYPFDTHIWVRRESRKIGIARSADSVNIPGFLLNGNPQSVALLDEEGNLGVIASADIHPRINGVMLPPGQWRARVIGSDSSLVVKIADSEGKEIIGEKTTAIGFELKEPATVDLEVEPMNGSSAYVYRLILSREDNK